MTAGSNPSTCAIQRTRWIGFTARLAPLLPLVAGAAWLRLHDLGYRSLWLDEVSTAQAVRLPDVGAVLDYVSRDPSATPLTYVVTWLARPIGGDEFAIRLPYAIAGLLAVLAMYALAERLFDRATGMAAGSLLAVLPYAIFYSQEARSYAFLMLFSTAVMLAAYRAANRGRVIDWLFLSIAGALDLYTGYLAIAVVAAAYGYVGLVVAADLAMTWRASWRRPELGAVARAGTGGVLSAGLIGVIFLPWFRHLMTLLGRPDQAFGRADTGHRPTSEEVWTLLQQLDLHGILLWLVLVGIGWAVVGIARGRWRRSLVPLAWFFVPLIGFAIGAGGGIVTMWPRYFGAVYPAAVLLAAAGINGLARGVGTAVRLGQRALAAQSGLGGVPTSRRRLVGAQPTARAIVIVCLCLLVGLDALPADADASARAKGSDYRGAVDAMLQGGEDRPWVLVLGKNPDWTVSGLAYYSWLRGSRLTVVDALKLTADDIKALESVTTVWGAAPTSTNVPTPPADVFVSRTFNDIRLLWLAARPAAPMDQVRSILGWASSFEPEISATTQLIEVLQGHSVPGPELLPPASASLLESGPQPLDRWVLQPGASLGSDGASFVLAPGGRSSNAYLTTLAAAPGRRYVLSFSCRSSELIGFANVFAVANGATGQTVFPDGAGYQCRSSPDPDHGVFAFTMPYAATSITVWLRATGSGTAGYADVSLRSLQ